MGCYGAAGIKTPNFDRFARRAVTFDTHFVGSLPCMPARRDLHTGRLNFMHSSWGPLEPFDNSFPEMLRRRGIHTHLVTDHLHYFEDGGSTYHTRFRRPPSRSPSRASPSSTRCSTARWRPRR
jgi:arylsulfatase A-like enzyme